MRLKVYLPAEILVDEEVTKVIAEAPNGSFCLLPRHIDFVSALEAGILSFVRTDGLEEHLAVDQGVLVKCGPEVRVATGDAALGPDLGMLQHAIEKKFRVSSEHERTVHFALVRLEAEFVRRFLEFGDASHE